MFKLQAQALLDAGMPPDWVAILTQCTQQVEHDGPVMYDYQWPPNATDNWGATRYRTNKNGIAGNVLQGRWVFGEDSSVEFNTLNVTFPFGFSIGLVGEGTLTGGDLVKDGSQIVTFTNGFKATAFDRFLATGKKLANGSRVFCVYYNNRWNVIQSVCPVAA